MIVCHCAVVSDREVRHHVASGAYDLDTLIDRCGAGGKCGGCRSALAALLDELLAAKATAGSGA